MDIISIIVPIYNIEKYLSRCIDSLLMQTYKNIEVILVNDGSKDNSLQICLEYAKKDSRIVVIDKVNEGVSIARNTGLEVAKGKYIGFVDPDDWIEINMYENIIKHTIKHDTDITLCNYFKDTKNKSVTKKFNFNKELLEGEDIKVKLINSMVGMEDIRPKVAIMGCVWRTLFKKELIEKHNIKFAEGLTIMEDLVFMIQVLLRCQKVGIEEGAYYHYVQNPSSALHTYNDKLWNDQIRVYNLLEESFIEAGIEDEMRNRLDIRYIGMIVASIKNETYMKKDSDIKGAVSHIRQICQDEKLRIILERLKPIQVSEKNTQSDKPSIKIKEVKIKSNKRTLDNKQSRRQKLISIERPSNRRTSKNFKIQNKRLSTKKYFSRSTRKNRSS